MGEIMYTLYGSLEQRLGNLSKKKTAAEITNLVHFLIDRY